MKRHPVSALCLSARCAVTAMALGLASQAQAIAINTTFQLADNTGAATYTITNNTDKRIFLNTVMYELKVENGGLEKIPYSRENIKDWKIEVYPARSVINPGFEKDFQVRLKCRDKCDNALDQAFQIGFVPTPYFAESERPQKAMQIAVGFAANFINPGKEGKLNYEIKRTDNGLQIHNKGSALFNALISSCGANATKEEKKTCEQRVHVLSKRDLPVKLPKEMLGKELKIFMQSADRNFKSTYTLAL